MIMDKIWDVLIGRVNLGLRKVSLKNSMCVMLI